MVQCRAHSTRGGRGGRGRAGAGYTPRGQHAPCRLRSTSSAPPHPCDVRPAESPTPGPPHPQVDPFRKDCLLNGLDLLVLSMLSPAFSVAIILTPSLGLWRVAALEAQDVTM